MRKVIVLLLLFATASSYAAEMRSRYLKFPEKSFEVQVKKKLRGEKEITNSSARIDLSSPKSIVVGRVGKYYIVKKNKQYLVIKKEL